MCNTYRIDINTLFTGLNNKELRNVKVTPTHGMFK